MPTNDTLTGAGLVEAAARAAWVYRSGGDPAAWPMTYHPAAAASCEAERERVRVVLRAAVEAAGVDAALLSRMARHHLARASTLASEWDRHGYDADKPHTQTAALLRALAEVVEAPDGDPR